MKKIDWTKPIRVAGTEAHYVGRTPKPDCPNVVAVWLDGLPDCWFYQVDDFGRDVDGLPHVINAPAPKNSYSGLWANIYEDRTGVYLFGHATRRGADLGAGGGRRIACIKLPDFTEGEGLE